LHPASHESWHSTAERIKFQKCTLAQIMNQADHHHHHHHHHHPQRFQVVPNVFRLSQTFSDYPQHCQVVSNIFRLSPTCPGCPKYCQDVPNIFRFVPPSDLPVFRCPVPRFAKTVVERWTFPCVFPGVRCVSKNVNVCNK